MYIYDLYSDGQLFFAWTPESHTPLAHSIPACLPVNSAALEGPN